MERGGVRVVTLKDIAQQAGVSPMTVSRVVNQQFGKVSEQTVQRIQRIIQESGYVPNSAARSLSGKSTRLIAVLVQGVENALEYPYNATMTGHICYYVQSRGYSPILCYINDYHDVAARLRTWHVEGAVFLGMFDEDMRNLQADHNIPLVFTDSYSAMRQVTNIGLDDFKGGELAAEYLLQKGHRRIAFLGASTDRSSIVRQRYDGFCAALSRAGVTLRKERVVFDTDFYQPVRSLCFGPYRPSAFFVAADIEAIQLMDHLRALGISVPEDCSVIGFDNLPFGAYTAPRLTTIAQDIQRKAQLAIDVLFRHIQDPALPAENIILDVALVERESVRRWGGE
jgi:LacI family transcriptional regulator